ncbi:MAG: glycosyltransferase family 4 protein [Prevotella sp.]|jgi:glycosyltransferase involved in cell wall biosynthesis|nr:glycosyltransferase family 4 protein [Prevotella sp.]
MRIGFDAKRAVSNFTGLGNYSRFVISNLMKYYPNNIYKLLIPKFPVDQQNEIRNDEEVYSLKNSWKPFWRTVGIVKNIKNERLDVYHGLSNELPYKINKTGAKSIVTIHDLIFLNYPSFYKLADRIIYDIKAKYACKIADKIIAVSECTKRDIIRYYNINPDKIEVVYQGCFPIFKETIDERQKQFIRNKYGLGYDYVLSVGSIERRKNILLIVKALKQVKDLHFVAIGKKREYANEVLRYAEENGIADRVHIMSDVPLTDLPAIYQSAKIFIYPSLYEGFGIPIIEALFSRIPVIGATGSCLEEAGGTDSIYINPNDENELSQQINRVLSDAQLRETMITKGAEFVLKFSDEKCTLKLMDIYKSLR